MHRFNADQSLIVYLAELSRSASDDAVRYESVRVLSNLLRSSAAGIFVLITNL